MNEVSVCRFGVRKMTRATARFGFWTGAMMTSGKLTTYEKVGGEGKPVPGTASMTQP